MILKTGISRSTHNTTPTQGSIQGLYQTSQNQLNSIPAFSPARVKDIVLDNNHPKFNSVGGANGIGAIFFEFTNKTGTNNVDDDNILYALPLISYLKIYPLINEIVFLINGPNQQTGELQSSTSYFYFPPLGIWNHPHHNAYPNLLFTSTLPPSQTQDYQQVGVGSVRRITDNSTEIELNSTSNPSQDTFIERTNIHPLSPFAGDIIYEGRWGNSFRLGSTSKSNSQWKNNWSTSGDNGDPITILRNGQPNDSTQEGWIPIVEDINKDLSSIYLTSTQKIPIEDTNWKTFISYGGKGPTAPSQYSNPQILLSSDRIVINSKNDSILLRSQNSISLSSVRSLNIDSLSTTIQSSNIFLGSFKAQEPGVKGTTLYNKLDTILTSLITLIRVLEVNQLWPAGLPTPDGGILTASSITKSQLQQELNSLQDILSKVVKTL